MKTTYRLSLVAVAALCLTACGADETVQNGYDDPNAVRISAKIGNESGSFQSRTNPLGTTEEQTQFNNGDIIAVAAGNQSAVKYKYNGTFWSPEQGKYLTWEGSSMDFTAYYPVGVNNASATSFTTPTSYADADAVAKADYMTYKGTQSNASGNDVTLAMERKMSRIVINEITFDGMYSTGYEVTGVKVHGNTKGYANGIVQTGDIAVSAYAQDGKYYALLSPTTAAEASTFVTVTIKKTGEEETTDVTAVGIPETKAGYSYTYNLKVAGNMVLSVANVSVEKWQDVLHVDQTATEIGIPTSVSIDQTYAKDNYLFAISDKSVTLDYTVEPAESNKERIQWSTSDETIATVDNGVVTFNQDGKFGDVTITAKCPNGTTSTITINIAEGLVRELFKDENNCNWTDGGNKYNNITTSHTWSDGCLTINTIKADATNKKQRGDLKCTSAKTWLNAGKYPFLVVRMTYLPDEEKVEKCSITFDAVSSTTCSGKLGKGSNTWLGDYKLSDGSHLFVYDLTSQEWEKGGVLPIDQTVEFTTFQFKYADIITTEELDPLSYKVYMVQTFKSGNEVSAYLKSENLTVSETIKDY